VVEEREIYLPGAGGRISVSCYDLERLHPGAEVAGPAVIWSPITTVVLPDGYRARVDGYRNLVMERVGQ
jgi:N-methylhydantoinase A/oxoprolinase/acetone carboxylase beta subunit